MASKSNRKRSGTPRKQQSAQNVGCLATIFQVFVSILSAFGQLISSIIGTSSTNPQKHDAFGNNTDGVIVRDLVPQAHLDSHTNGIVTRNPVPQATTPVTSKTSYAGKAGYVYILANSSMPGLIKIGMTTRSPQMRAAELSRGTGIPTPYQVVGYAYVNNRQIVEKELHILFAARRKSANREFFAVDVADARAALQKLAYIYSV